MKSIFSSAVYLFLVICLSVNSAYANLSVESRINEYADNKTNQLSQSEAELAFVIYRHADRSPYTFPPNDPFAADAENIWPNGPGQLTNEGKRRSFELGRYLAKRYVAGHLFSWGANPSPRLVRAVSSDSDRCIATTIQVLAGALVPRNQWIWTPPIVDYEGHKKQHPFSTWQPVAVHERSEMLNPEWPCNERQKMIESAFDYAQQGRVFERQHIQHVRVPPARIKQWLIASYGYRFESLYDYYDAGSNLLIENSTATSMRMSQQLPTWYDELSAPSLQLLAGSANWLHVSTEPLKRLTSGILLDDIVDRITAYIESKKIREPKNDPRLFLYGTHDTIVLGLLESLGAWNVFREASPDFCSSVLIELHRRKSSDTDSGSPTADASNPTENLDENYEIRLFYNPKFPTSSQEWQEAARAGTLYQERSMGVCERGNSPESRQKDSYCTPSNLRQSTNSLRLTSSQWHQECDMNQ